MIGIKGNYLANFIVEYINNKRDDIISELNNNLDIRKINNQTDASEQIQKLTLYINFILISKLKYNSNLKFIFIRFNT